MTKGTHIHDDEEDEGDIDVGEGMPPVRENQLIIQVLHLTQSPGDVAEQVVDRLLVRQLKTTANKLWEEHGDDNFTQNHFFKVSSKHLPKAIYR